MSTREAERQARAAHRRLAEDIDRLTADSGITHAALAREAGISPGHLADVLAGKRAATIRLYAKLAVPLGADLSTRMYPNTGPKIRDRHQGRILEHLLTERHPRWEPFTELAVRSPARGYIDAALFERREPVIVATEVESELRRLEQLVRWSIQKAESLPSWEGWFRLAEPPAVSRLLVVRRTRATRAVARDFAQQLLVAYPAHPDDAVASLTGTRPWPGPALVWVSIEADRVRLLSGR